MRIFLLAVWTLLLGSSNLCVKLMMNGWPEPWQGWAPVLRWLTANPWPALAGFTYFCGVIVSLAIFKIMPVAIAGSLFAILGLVASTFVGVAVLGESLTMTHWAGIGLAVTSAALLLW